MGPLQCRRTAAPCGSTWTPSSSTSGPASRSTGSSGTRFGGRSWRGDCARGSGSPPRGLAGSLGVGRNTVASAYDQLTSEGYLVPSVGSGTRVSRTLPERLLNAPRPGPTPAGRRRRRPLAFVGPRPGDRRIRAPAGPRWRPARAVPAARPRARRLPARGLGAADLPSAETAAARPVRPGRLARLSAPARGRGRIPGGVAGSAARPTTSSSPPGCSRGST